MKNLNREAQEMADLRIETNRDKIREIFEKHQIPEDYREKFMATFRELVQFYDKEQGTYREYCYGGYAVYTFCRTGDVDCSHAINAWGAEVDDKWNE